MRFVLVVLLSAICLRAQTGDTLKRLDFLLGDWVGIAGEKDTPQGAGQGDFSFHADLNGKIIVRRNAARYDSGEKHDDLMIIYLDDPGAPRAIYFDAEGHVIHCKIAFPAADRVEFESDMFRLTYWMENSVLNGKFEVGGKPYLNWKSRKRG